MQRVETRCEVGCPNNIAIREVRKHRGKVKHKTNSAVNLVVESRYHFNILETLDVMLLMWFNQEKFSSENINTPKSLRRNTISGGVMNGNIKTEIKLNFRVFMME